MQGISNSLKISLSGLQLAQHGLAVASNNISNVNTPGYTRKTLEQEAHVVAGRGAGVSETDLTRLVDSFLEHQVRVQEGKIGRSEIVNDYLSDVQGLIFGNPTDEATGFATFIDTFATKLDALAADPDDSALRAATIWAAKDFFQQVSRGVDTTQALRRDADRRIANLVDEVNVAVQGIHDINLELKRNSDSPDLLDQRDRLVLELSRKMDVHTYTQHDGSIAVFTNTGQALLELQPNVIAYNPSSDVQRVSTFGPISIFTKDEIDPATGAPIDWSKGKVLVGSGTRAQLPAELAALGTLTAIDPTVDGGELGGLLEVRDKLLPELDDQLLELGRLIKHALNDAHNASNPLPLPSALDGSRLRADVTGASVTGLSGKAYLQVDAGTTNVYEIDLDAAADADAIVAQINAFDPGNLTATLNPGEGLKVTWTGAPPAGGVSIAIANEGPAPATPATITQVDDAGHTWEYGFAHFFGFNDMVVATEGDDADLSIRADIDADPMKLSTARLDVIDNAGTLEGQLGSVGDNRGFLDLAQALDEPLTTVGRGGLASAKVSPREYLGDLINVQALRANNAEQTAETDRTLAEELGYQKASVSGVNLDEEMAHLIQLQQAYAASAKLMSTADEMLDALLAIKR